MSSIKRVQATVPGKQIRRPFALLSLLVGFMLVLSACGADPTATSAPAASAAASSSARPSTAASTAPSAAASASTAGGASTAPSAAASGSASSAPSAAASGSAASSARPAATPGTPTASGSGATPNTSIKITGKQGDADTLNGAGATFPQVLYSRWFDDYNKATGVKVNYQANGSSAGKKAITDQTADFAGSDSIMSDAELEAARAKCGDTVMHIPSALGSIAVTYNIPELPTTKLKMSADIVAGIFLGTIKKWNDPKIAAENAGVNLPNADIIVVRRSDGSGTTDNFTGWLADANAEWKSKVGVGTTVNWPVGIGANGNAGVAGELKNNPYSIGYVETIFANQQKLPYADIKNKAGNYVTPSNAAVTAAAQQVAPQVPADFRFRFTNADGAQSYPITVLTYLLVCPKQTDQAKAIALTRMLWWATHEAQATNETLDFAKIPDAFVVRIEGMINNITVNGQKAFPGK
jgi:phosphate transport system substrate-binding protein